MRIPFTVASVGGKDGLVPFSLFIQYEINYSHHLEKTGGGKNRKKRGLRECIVMSISDERQGRIREV